MTEFVQRRPGVYLLILVAVNILLISIQVRSEEGHLLLRSWGLRVFTPIASTLHFVTQAMEDVAERYAFLRNTEKENQRLREENARLKVELDQLRGLKSAVTRTSDYRLVSDQYLFETRVAGIIWKSAPFYAQRVLINAGTRQGVKKDAAILTPAGVVGRVLVTSPSGSEVELITNAGAAAGAMLRDSRLQGVVQGDGSTLLGWNFIPNYENVEVGEVVYTSGTDKIYPKGLPIGQVIQSEKSSLIYREIVVQPFVDFARLEEVMVVAR